MGSSATCPSEPRCELAATFRTPTPAGARGRAGAAPEARPRGPGHGPLRLDARGLSARAAEGRAGPRREHVLCGPGCTHARDFSPSGGTAQLGSLRPCDLHRRQFSETASTNFRNPNCSTHLTLFLCFSCCDCHCICFHLSSAHPEGLKVIRANLAIRSARGAHLLESSTVLDRRLQRCSRVQFAIGVRLFRGVLSECDSTGLFGQCVGQIGHSKSPFCALRNSPSRRRGWRAATRRCAMPRVGLPWGSSSSATAPGR